MGGVDAFKGPRPRGAILTHPDARCHAMFTSVITAIQGSAKELSKLSEIKTCPSNIQEDPKNAILDMLLKKKVCSYCFQKRSEVKAFSPCTVVCENCQHFRGYSYLCLIAGRKVEGFIRQQFQCNLCNECLHEFTVDLSEYAKENKMTMKEAKEEVADDGYPVHKDQDGYTTIFTPYMYGNLDDVIPAIKGRWKRQELYPRPFQTKINDVQPLLERLLEDTICTYCNRKKSDVTVNTPRSVICKDCLVIPRDCEFCLEAGRKVPGFFYTGFNVGACQCCRNQFILDQDEAAIEMNLTPSEFRAKVIEMHIPSQNWPKDGEHFLLPQLSQECRERAIAMIKEGWKEERLLHGKRPPKRSGASKRSMESSSYDSECCSSPSSGSSSPVKKARKDD
eukprot:77431-Hanusia_phi.AAC.3